MGYKNKLEKGLGTLLLFLFVSSIAYGQQSLIHDYRYPDYNNALNLFEKEKFVPALTYFEKVINEIKEPHSEVKVEAEYYQALCAVELFHNNAELLLRKFILNHPDYPRLIVVHFNLANYQFRKKKFKAVVNQLSAIDPLDLSLEDRAEYYFKLGYANFQEEEYEEASNYFFEIKDTDNAYVSAARYYYAHINYAKGNYQTAVENFQKIAKDRQFGPLVPYYLTQIFYLQKKYEQLVRYAPPVLDSAPPKRESEIRKFIGDSYFELEKYDSAVIFLNQYLSSRSGIQSDYYQLGFALKQVKKYDESIKYLKKAIGLNDTINQSAYYFIGESSILLDRKLEAKNAFRAAERIDVNPKLKEDALFNYAKVSYELAYHPYDDAILAFEEYINKYPNSIKLENAYEYLLGVYYTTKNYKEALKSLDRINNQSYKLSQAKQRIALFRGVELFNEQAYDEAIELFEIAIKNNHNPLFKSKATYWMAESYYQLKDYDNSISFYTDFLASAGARSLPNFNRAFYNLAYAYYDKKKYSTSVFWFKEYLENADKKNKGLISDAYLRVGDSYFIQKDYNNAITYYELAADLNLSNSDYALLQTAISFGVVGDYDSKIKRLKKIVESNKTSNYTDDAIYELGKTYLIKNKNEDALAYYNQLIVDYPSSNYLADANLKVGLIHYNSQKDDLALNAFDKVIKNYPNTKESKEALEKIRKVFIDKGDANGFENYINGVPFANISKKKLDSTSYVVAENNYLEGNCDNAVRDFTNYLKKYPKGLFELNAHFYRAECELAGEFFQEAALDYEFVVRNGASKFLENSLLGLGEIYIKLNEVDSAIKVYSKLLVSAKRQTTTLMAEKKLMQIFYDNKKYDEAKGFAYSIVSVVDQSPKLLQKARMILAKSYFEKEAYDSTKKQLSYILGYKNEIGAEAKYMAAKIEYLQGNYSNSDSLVYLLVDQVPSYPFWIANGFILLADNFIAKEDFYNARITFQSVIDNAEDEKLVGIAKMKLSILEESLYEIEKGIPIQDTIIIDLETPRKIEFPSDSMPNDSLVEPNTIPNED